MEPWVASLLAIVVGISGGWIGAHIGARVAIARLEERSKTHSDEIAKLREAKHEHAGFLTKHELDIEMLKRRLK